MSANPPATSLYRQQNPLAGGPTSRDLSLHADCLPACKGVDGQLYPSGHHRACPHHSSNRKVAPQELASPALQSATIAQADEFRARVSATFDSIDQNGNGKINHIEFIK